MLASDIPVKIDLPFATNAGDLKNQIPDQPSGVVGRASFSLGFPSATMQPLEVGGVPPFGQDMNGLMFQATSWLRWQAAGGPLKYDSAFASQIGGYPAGATLQSADGLGWWFSTADNNTANPDTIGTGWVFVPIYVSYAGDPNGHVSGHAATTTSPPSLVWDTVDLILWRSTGGTAWTPLLSVNPVVKLATATRNYTAADNGNVYVRSNSGSVMSDALPSLGNVTNGWGVTVFNADPSANLALTCTTHLNGVANGTITLSPRQNVKVNVDANGDFWSTVPPIPQVFSGQAVYVNTSGSYPPGVYDIDTSAGSITFQLELSGVQGDNYLFRDVTGTFASHNLIIDPNGRTIEGQTGNFACDVNWSQFLLSRNIDTDWSFV